MALLLEKSRTIHEALLQMALEILQKHKGNKTHAARELGITPRCLRYWVTKYDVLKDFRNPRDK